MKRPRRLLVCALLGGLLAGTASASGDQATYGLQIYAVRVDGGSAKNLSRTRFEDDWPAVSPDGRKIAFVRYVSDSGIWLMNADGRGRRKLVDVSGQDELTPVWSPDGRRLAFVTMTACEPYFCSDVALWLVRPDGTGLRRIGRNVRQPWRPLWSPDGTRLLLGQILNPDGEVSSLVALRVRDGAVWTLGYGLFAFEDWSWSPDGRRVTYVATAGNTNDAYVEGAEGRARRVLTRNAYSAQWSPEGREIAVIKRFGRNRIRLARIPVRGGPASEIAPASAFAWDRNGRRLALFRDGGPVRLVRRDGRGLRTVAWKPGWPQRSEMPAGPGPGPWTWFPDGRGFVYPASTMP
jgi:dipeptidyl aminopeptidase/acylaminoacyl peptidase